MRGAKWPSTSINFLASRYGKVDSLSARSRSDCTRTPEGEIVLTTGLNTAPMKGNTLKGTC